MSLFEVITQETPVLEKPKQGLSSRADLEKLAALATKCGGTAEILGFWVWVSFPGKPGPEARQELKAAKFRFSPKKEKWYFAGKPCGRSKGMSMEYIRQKYSQDD